MDAAVTLGTNGKRVVAVGVAELTLRENDERDGLEIVFPTKPTPEQLEVLGPKHRGSRGIWRYHRQAGLWYTKRSDPARHDAARILTALRGSA